MGRTLLSAERVRLSFGTRMVLDIDKFSLREGDRIGLVGENGAGKTTLIRILSGARSPDEGSVRALTGIAVIRQDRRDDPGDASAELRSRFCAPECGENLSGGEETRRRIAAALSSGAHILLADEPTSDLDEDGVKRLTEALRTFDGALLLVSHDRALLDDVTTAIAELQDGKLTLYPGNYTAYRAELNNRRAFEQSEYEKYRADQARLCEAIQDKVERASQVALPSRMGNSEARLHKRAVSKSQANQHQLRKALETRLDKLPEKRRPREDPSIRMEIPSGDIASRTAIEARGLTLSAGGTVLLNATSFRVPTGSHTALLGPNGCGKTTLIRAVMAIDGISVAPGVRIGLMDQDTGGLDDGMTALENAMRTSVQSEGAVRTVLARLGIRGDAVYKQARLMSGGERVKVTLARLMASDVNLLILDEPTNHLDVFSLEALGEVLSDYRGTLLFVSHDRRFVEQVATRLVLFQDRRLTEFEGTMSEWKSRGISSHGATDRIVLEMRMAELTARMAKPRKGDNPALLNQMYDELAAQVRAVRNM